MTKTPLNLKGFRDLLPAQKRQRDFVADRITQIFEVYGFEPLETPTLEYAELLTGKYGDEADKLVYTFTDKGDRQVGLRYDQTVPTARVLAQYKNDLPKFFRRYQIQNVFRADKPQAGRFREFTQCDIDIFGATSPLADAEILACTYAAYKNVGFANIELFINDRQTLISTLSPFANEQVDVLSIIQSIDKLDKQTTSKVAAELTAKGLDETTADAALNSIEKADMSNNLKEIVHISQTLGVPSSALKFNPKLARGLDYYTGMIFEVIIPEYEVGSVGGGGRYDNLINDLSGTDMPAVGMAFGFDRTVAAAAQLGLIPTSQSSAQVLVTMFDQKTSAAALETARTLRQAGISTELYPAYDKLGKQFKLANQKQIPYVVVIGETELADKTVTVKEMASGEQVTESIESFVERIGKK